MKRFLTTTALISMLGVSSALAEGVALVIGNGEYENAPAAATAVRDANSISAALTEAGPLLLVHTLGLKRARSRFPWTM